MFAEARLVLMGERIDYLPQDENYLNERRRMMNYSVTVFLLFNMALTAISAWLQWTVTSHAFGDNMAITLASLFFIGGMFWGLRFSVAYIVAAVGYPFRAFLQRSEGMEFSLRLLGMGLLCAFPVYLALELLLEILFPELTSNPAPETMSMVIVVSAPIAFAVPVLLNAAAAYALKDMLGGGERRA
jgi:hypothetical protein